METLQIIVGVFVVFAFFFCGWIAIREIVGLYKDMKKDGMI